MYNYNTVSGEASHSNRSNIDAVLCNAWLVAIASLSLNTVQCLYKNTKSGFVPIIVLTPPSRLPISQNNRLMSASNDTIHCYD